MKSGDPSKAAVNSAPYERKPLTRRDLAVGYAILSGLVAVLGIGFAVIVSPGLIDAFRDYLPLLATIGFVSTVGGFWWLWWRPR